MNSFVKNMCASAVLDSLIAGIKDVAAVCCSFGCGGCCDFTNVADFNSVGLVCAAMGGMYENVMDWRELSC